jgi:hypothetical protein
VMRRIHAELVISILIAGILVTGTIGWVTGAVGDRHLAADSRRLTGAQHPRQSQRPTGPRAAARGHEDGRAASSGSVDANQAAPANGSARSHAADSPGAGSGEPGGATQPTTGTTVPGGPTPPAGPRLEADGAKPPIPVDGAFFGAFVNYNHNLSTSTQTADLETDLGRTLDVDHHYAPWTGRLAGPDETADEQAGRIPFVSWGCTGVAAIEDGSQDGVIRQAAAAVKAFDHPLYLEWYWEMNLSNNSACLDGQGGPGFVAAWRHIWGIFQAEGTVNAAWVWCPGAAGSQGLTAAYYPGDTYVDYVCADGYSRNGTAPSSFGSIFGAFYQQWATRKPMIVGETGAVTGSSSQASWLASAAKQIPRDFPQIKVVLYFDAAGWYDYTVTAGSSVTAFASWSRGSYFNPTDRPLRPEGSIQMVDGT